MAEEHRAADLEVSNLGFSYGNQAVLKDISFTAHAGDLIALVGPNGVGKSTMFKCILGFLKGHQGTIRIDGRLTGELSAKETARLVAYIPQSSAQVFDYTVLELVLMGLASQLSLLATPSKTEEDRALAVLDELSIAHLAHRGCGQISGGEYQLALLARALLQQARILIMDEPTANLDYGNQYRVMERIGNLTKRDFIVMLAAHDPNQVLQHATRALIIKEGSLLADGAPADVMTEELLSSIYGIEVRRLMLKDDEREYQVCVATN